MVGPGMGSARSNRAASSAWQKYWVRNSSGRQAIWAPRSAASISIALARLQVVVRVGRAPHLDQAHAERSRFLVHGVGLALNLAASTDPVRSPSYRVGQGGARLTWRLV